MKSSSVSLVQFRAFNSREITGGSAEDEATMKVEVVKEADESQEQLLLDDSFFED